MSFPLRFSSALFLLQLPPLRLRHLLLRLERGLIALTTRRIVSLVISDIRSRISSHWHGRFRILSRLLFSVVCTKVYVCVVLTEQAGGDKLSRTDSIVSRNRDGIDTQKWQMQARLLGRLPNSRSDW